MKPFIKATDLKTGDTFKKNPRIPKTYWIQEIKKLDRETDRIRKADHGKIQINTWCCNKILLNPEDQVFLIHSPQQKDVSYAE